MTESRVAGRFLALALCSLLFARGAALAGTFPAATEAHIDEIEALVRSAQFLSRATFGPTKDEIAERGYAVADIRYGDDDKGELW